jgi:hypothetical protein
MVLHFISIEFHSVFLKVLRLCVNIGSFSNQTCLGSLIVWDEKLLEIKCFNSDLFAKQSQNMDDTVRKVNTPSDQKIADTYFWSEGVTFF